MNVNFDKLDSLYNLKTDIILDISELDFNIVNKNSFLTFHLNIRSITKHFSQLLIMLNTKLQFFDCIILTECWLKNCVINFKLTGFNAYKTQENNFNQNSGIIVYVNKKDKINNVNEIMIDYLL